MKTYYVICAMISDMPISLDGTQQDKRLPLVWADGMCGVLPVFTNKRKAGRYADSFGAGVEVIGMSGSAWLLPGEEREDASVPGSIGQP